MTTPGDLRYASVREEVYSDYCERTGRTSVIQFLQDVVDGFSLDDEGRKVELHTEMKDRVSAAKTLLPYLYPKVPQPIETGEKKQTVIVNIQSPNGTNIPPLDIGTMTSANPTLPGEVKRELEAELFDPAKLSVGMQNLLNTFKGKPPKDG